MKEPHLSMRESIGSEINDRAAQREQIEALFKSRPLQDIEPEELRAITPHYQQRISELRRKRWWMRIENIARHLELADGTKKKRDGAYRFTPYKRLGRDGSELLERRWIESGAYQDQDFRLKP